MITMNYIGDAKKKGNDILVLRDQHGKFYVKINGITTQKRLNAKEIVGYLLNAMNDA